MSSFTPNINLLLTPENDTTTTFKEWRTGINGENDNSNMSKIDKAIGDLSKSCSDLSDKVDSAFDKSFGGVQTWKDVQTIVRNGKAAQYFNIGDQFVVEKLTDVTASVGESTGVTAVTVDANKFVEGIGETKGGEYVFKFDNHSWHDTNGSAIKLVDYGITITGTPKANDTITVTETTEQLVFDVIGIDHDTPADANYKHSMTLQLHDVLTDYLVYDEPEATWYIDKATYPNGLKAGTYWFQYPEDWGGDTYQFILTKDVPVGGQVMFDDANTSDILTYATVGDTTILEQVSKTTGNSGTELPAPLVYDHTDNTNDLDRAYGSNNWSESAVRQWMNSAESAGNWWSAQTVFDRPPAYAKTKDGFLKNIDRAFLDVVGDVIKTTQLSATDGYGLDTSTERFFLPSRSEVYGGVERSADGADGTAYPYYGAGYSNLSAPGTGSDKNRIKYRNGSTCYWWLRTPSADYGHDVRYVNSNGCLSSYGAYNSYGVAPACVIV